MIELTAEAQELLTRALTWRDFHIQVHPEHHVWMDYRNPGVTKTGCASCRETPAWM